MFKESWSRWLGIIIVVIGLVLFLAYWQAQSAQYSLTGLYPQVAQATEQLIKNCKERGIAIKITEGFRSFEKQDQLYAKGRTVPGEIVTYAEGGESYHNYGLAVDFALFDAKRKRLSWDMERDGNKNGVSDWEEVAQEAKKLGFDWGGDWSRFKDYPHLEMTFGQSIVGLKATMKLREWMMGETVPKEKGE
ncbi:M15 family metallopeptidase [Laceyella putida]|uniref:M15 family metallopeptidase n=1 Tax=Laceyella putida TaxID=110101 RepID=A0ABW2RFE4_9BACL